MKKGYLFTIFLVKIENFGEILILFCVQIDSFDRNLEILWAYISCKLVSDSNFKKEKQCKSKSALLIIPKLCIYLF